MASRRTEKLLGREFRKLHPKLRMFSKAHDDVNSVRSEFASSLRVKPALARAISDEETRLPDVAKHGRLKTPKLREVSGSVEVNVFVSKFSAHDGESADRVIKNQSCVRCGELETGTLALDALGSTAEQIDVAFIELGEALKKPDVEVSMDKVSAPLASERNIPGRDNGGKNVLIGIIDVGGFDFSHPDFLNREGYTRWISIWDQADGPRSAPEPFNYGSEILQSHMDDAIDASDTAGLPPWALEPQSSMASGSHGTHVASIAAGNRGICRNAFIAGVLIDLPDELAVDRRKSFYDSTRVAHAVTYLCNLAEQIKEDEGLDELPVSINISLGTNGGAHDASNGASRWIDNELAVPGRSVCVAAGNAGQEAPTSPADIGFTMGRIHTSGRIEARGLNSDIELIVVGNTISDISENELEIWYSGADRIGVTITPPGMDPIGPINPQEYIQNQLLSDGSMLSVYNELYHPSNGSNYIAIYLSPFLQQNPVIGVKPGLWKIRLHGIEVRDGRYHGWIERDDPRRRGVVGTQEYWNFPSFFSSDSNVDNSSVSSFACGQRVVSVANLDSATESINISSSQGPTRDDRQKPDVAAPGTDIVAANGFSNEEEGRWVEMTGTSMASPYVAGVVGLMLEVAPHLTAAQVVGIIQRTSQPLPGNNFTWTDDAGYGQLMAAQCVMEARNLANRVKLNP